MMLSRVAKEHGWVLNYSAIAFAWQGALCAVRSALLSRVKAAFDRNPTLWCLLLDSYFVDALGECQDSWRHVVATAVRLGMSTPAIGAALAFYDGCRAQKAPFDLVQVRIVRAIIIS